MNLSKLFLIVLVLLSTMHLNAIVSNDIQVRISQVDPSEFPFVNLYVSVTGPKGDPIPGIRKENFSLSEIKEDEKRYAEIFSAGGIDKADVPVNIILLLDISASMTGEKLSKAKDAAKAFLKLSPSNFSISISTFNDIINATIPITRYNYSDAIDSLNATGNTKLYGAIYQKMMDLKEKRGRKAIVILTDGKDTVDIGYDKKKLFEQIPISNVSVYTIGLGNDVNEQELKSIAEETGSEYYFSPDEYELEDVFQNVAENISNEFLVKYQTPFRNWSDYRGLKRVVSISLFKNNSQYSNSASYFIGGITGISKSNWKLFLGGLTGLILILVLLIFILPLFKMFYFRALYIHPYGKVKLTSIKNKIDLYTYTPITDSTIVVTKCDHWISLENWRHNGNKCTEYPIRCNSGVGNPGYKIDFFNQKGTNKYLNWLWFGAIGGFIAWVLTAFILELIPLKPLSDIILKAILKTGMTTDLNISGIISTLRESITGLFVGGCLGFALGIVEELLQGFSASSIVKILVRSIFGAIIGGIGFFIGNVFFIMLFNSDYVGRLIGWLILGGILGGGLTFYSGSEFWKGMIGGLLGAITGFHLYYLSTSTTIWGIETGILIGIIFLCSNIGFIESMVISNLKEFYLEYASGSKSGMIIPVSKWIKKKASKLIIGNANDCHIRVHGDSNICDYHCEVHFDPENQRVLLTPLSKNHPLEINNRVISKASRIKNGDIIKIGNTSFKYNESRKYFKKL